MPLFLLDHFRNCPWWCSIPASWISKALHVISGTKLWMFYSVFCRHFFAHMNKCAQFVCLCLSWRAFKVEIFEELWECGSILSISAENLSILMSCLSYSIVFTIVWSWKPWCRVLGSGVTVMRIFKEKIKGWWKEAKFVNVVSLSLSFPLINITVNQWYKHSLRVPNLVAWSDLIISCKLEILCNFVIHCQYAEATACHCSYNSSSAFLAICRYAWERENTPGFSFPTLHLNRILALFRFHLSNSLGFKTFCHWKQLLDLLQWEFRYWVF